MHELALAREIVAIVEGEASRHGASAVRRIIVEIGVLSHVDPRALAFCFAAAAKGTPAAGAVLETRAAPARVQCAGCGRNVGIAKRGDACPECGSFDLVTARGEELKVKAMEIE